MNVFDLQAVLTLDKNNYEKGLSDASRSANTIGKKIASAIGTIGKISMIGLGAAATSVGAIIKQSVSAYGEFEQLAGGIQKLYGTTAKSFDEYVKTVQGGSSAAGKAMGQFEDIAKEVIAGKWGVGQERKDLLKAAGYDPELVQQTVNAMLDGTYKVDTAVSGAAGKTTEQMRKDYDALMKAQEMVLANSQDAWRTTGMSANEYMSSAMSFAAKLTTDFGGDTVKAAEYSDKAMRQMADNANTFGKFSADELAGVYQALARGNYTTLDNLSLGFSGTKQGMEDLLKRAEELTGKKFNIENFGDIIDAIQAVQDNLQVTGTTEREAMETIEGSAHATAAAWQNVLTAMAGGGDLNKSIDGLIQSLFGKNGAGGLLNNIKPRVTSALKGVAKLIRTAAPVFAKEIPKLLEEITPDFLDSAATIIDTLSDSLPGMLNAILPAIVSILPKIITSFVTAIPKLASTLVSNLPAILTALGQAAVEIGTVIWNGITGAFDKAGKWFKDLLYTGIDGEETTSIDWSVVGEKILNGIKSKFDAVGKWLRSILLPNDTADGYTSESDWEVIGTAIKDGALSKFDAAHAWIKDKFNAAKDAIKAIQWAEIGQTILDSIEEKVKIIRLRLGFAFFKAKLALKDIKWAEIGENIINGIKEKLTDAGTWLKDIFSKGFAAAKTVPWTEIGQTIIAKVSDAFTKAGDWLIGLLLPDDNEIAKEGEASRWSGLGDKILEGIKLAFTNKSGGTAAKFIDALSAMFDGIQWDKIIDNLSTLGMFIVTAIGKAIDGAADGASMLTTSIGNFISAQAEKVGESGLVEHLGGLATNIINALAHAIGKAVETASNIITALADVISTIDWATVGAQIRTVAENIVNAIAEKLGSHDILEASLTLFKEAAKAIIEFFAGLFTGEAFDSEGLTKAKEAVEGVFNWLIEHKDSVIGTLKAIGTAIGVYIVGSGILTAIDSISKFLAGGVTLSNPILTLISVISFLVMEFIQLWNTSEAFRNFWIDLWDRVTKPVKDFIDRIKEVVEAIKALASGNFQGARDVLAGVLNTQDRSGAGPLTLSEANKLGLNIPIEEIDFSEFELSYTQTTQNVNEASEEAQEEFDETAKASAEAKSQIIKDAEALNKNIANLTDMVNGSNTEITESVADTTSMLANAFAAMGTSTTNNVSAMQSQVHNSAFAIIADMNRLKAAISGSSGVSAFVAGLTSNTPLVKGLQWHDDGGIFTRPTIIGVGEKRPEIVGALDDFRKIVREESGGRGQQTNNFYITSNDPDEVARKVSDILQGQYESRKSVFA